ncbi:MAG: glutamine-hydrolyzing GMP synthase, partial [Ignavibacteriaceae bacterium]|nr:glutamine-hydrolyzing GMP synthase [Ignavibacteriaceae bacterium]
MKRETILIIDFGSQYTQLITRRVREANVYSEIHSNKISLKEIKKLKPVGIILSGGPMSVYDEDAATIDNEILKLSVPILGICYGLQYICQTAGGKVEKANDREYGKAALRAINNSDLFAGLKDESTVWMSHGDLLTRLPNGFDIIGQSDHSPICAIADEEKKIYGVQFHPE